MLPAVTSMPMEHLMSAGSTIQRFAERLRLLVRLAVVSAVALVAAGAAFADEAPTKPKRPAQKRGGYSYSAQDTINTYGDSRVRYGSTNAYRFWGADRQTSSGPFDHGFFFDSGIAPHGGDSPYLH